MANEKILLVDDEPDYLQVLGARLRAHGYIVLTASGGKEGVEKAQTERPAVILLDIMMPEVGGGEVAGILGDMLGTECPPIIYLSALVSSKEADRSNVRDGFETVLPKTADANMILSTVRRVLDARAARSKH